jgi:hypothetical protein
MGQPDGKQGGSEQKSAKAPEVHGSDSLADGQNIPDHTAEERGQGEKPLHKGQSVDQCRLGCVVCIDRQANGKGLSEQAIRKAKLAKPAWLLV